MFSAAIPSSDSQFILSALFFFIDPWCIPPIINTVFHDRCYRSGSSPGIAQLLVVVRAANGLTDAGCMKISASLDDRRSISGCSS